MVRRMNLSETQQLILENRGKALLALGFFILVVLAIVFLIQKQRGGAISEEEKLPPLALQVDTGSVIGQPDLSKLPSLDVPSTLSTYTASPLDVSSTATEAQEIAARFEITANFRQIGLEVESRLYSFSQGEETVAITSQPRDLRYIQVGFSFSSAAVKGTLYDASTAAQKALAFMEEKELITSNLVLSAVRYLNAQGELSAEVTDPAKAHLAEVSFARTLNGREVWGETIVDTAARVVFNRAGKVVLLNFKFMDQNITQLGEAELRPLGEAANSLRDEGLVISLRPVRPGSEVILDTLNLTAFTPKLVKLAYLLPRDSAYLHPVYIFEGNGQTPEGEVRAIVIVSAIQPRYIRGGE